MLAQYVDRRNMEKKDDDFFLNKSLQKSLSCREQKYAKLKKLQFQGKIFVHVLIHSMFKVAKVFVLKVFDSYKMIRALYKLSF